MISVVCLYNDIDLLEEWLLKSLKDQSTAFELITVDNRKGKFTSSAAGLNYGGSLAGNRYIMFVHQDVRLSNSTWLEEAEKYLDSLDNPGVAGIAGRSGNFSTNLSNSINGIPPTEAGMRIDESVEVQTLDGSLIIVPREVFREHKFDEKTCDSWYLYATEYCLKLGKEGYKIYVIPLEIHHRSMGFEALKSEEYQRTQEKIMEKYQDVGVIFTTTGVWKREGGLK